MLTKKARIIIRNSLETPDDSWAGAALLFLTSNVRMPPLIATLQS